MFLFMLLKFFPKRDSASVFLSFILIPYFFCLFFSCLKCVCSSVSRQAAGVMSVYLFMKRYTAEEMYRPHQGFYRPRLSNCSDYSGQFLHPDAWAGRGRSPSSISSEASLQMNSSTYPALLKCPEYEQMSSSPCWGAFSIRLDSGLKHPTSLLLSTFWLHTSCKMISAFLPVWFSPLFFVEGSKTEANSASSLNPQLTWAFRWAACRN